MFCTSLHQAAAGELTGAQRRRGAALFSCRQYFLLEEHLRRGADTPPAAGCEAVLMAGSLGKPQRAFGYLGLGSAGPPATDPLALCFAELADLPLSHTDTSPSQGKKRGFQAPTIFLILRELVKLKKTFSPF